MGKTSDFYEVQRCEATVVDGFSRLVAINGNELQRLPHIHILSRGVRVQTWYQNRDGQPNSQHPLQMANDDMSNSPACKQLMGKWRDRHHFRSNCCSQSWTKFWWEKRLTWIDASHSAEALPSSRWHGAHPPNFRSAPHASTLRGVAPYIPVARLMLS